MNTEEALEIVGEPWPRSRKLHCPAHEDRSPSLHLYDDSFYCFACSRNGDAYGLIALLADLPIEQVLRKYGGPRPDKAKVAKKVTEREMRTELELRLVTSTQPIFEALRDSDLEGWAFEIVHDRADDLVRKYRSALRDASPYEAEMLLRDVPKAVAGFVETWHLTQPTT